MNQINYDREMDKLLSQIKKENLKPKLLLHACCAPCASACIERLIEFFDITVYFYNPNMDTCNEYSLRAEELKRLCLNFGVKCLIDEYDQNAYYKAVQGLESELEGGKRCEKCFRLRLNKTAEKARRENAEYFATTLTVSPLKNARLINEIGEEVGNAFGVKYLASDFKKKNGYIRSIELSKALNLYRQNYCGCVFSKRSQL